MNPNLGCEACGRSGEFWGKLSTCCEPHGRTICDDCYYAYNGWAQEGRFEEPCLTQWDRILAPEVDECIAELRQWVAEDLASPII